MQLPSIVHLGAGSTRKPWRQPMHSADRTHVGWISDPVMDDRELALAFRSRPRTDRRLAGQGPRKAHLACLVKLWRSAS